MKRRVLAIFVLCALLVGLFVWHGTLEPNSAENRFPSNDELAAGELESGDRVVIGGSVTSVESDSLRVTPYGFDGRTISVENVENGGVAGEPGDDIWLYGTVRPGDTVDAERMVVRAPWEIAYMYAVSILAAVWVFGRFVRGWRFDREEFGFVPRTDGLGVVTEEDGRAGAVVEDGGGGDRRG